MAKQELDSNKMKQNSELEINKIRKKKDKNETKTN
jgi:hypothetical protein